MKPALLLSCALFAVLCLLLRGALRAETWTVSIRYDYPAVQSRADTPHAEGSGGEIQFPLDLNRATREELMQVPRIGEVLSARIIEYRKARGGFAELTQLKEIKGISDKTLENISPYLAVLSSYEPEVSLAA